MVEGMNKMTILCYCIEGLFVNLCSNSVFDQVDFAIFTREMYRICGVSSSGFCAEVCSNGVRIKYHSY